MLNLHVKLKKSAAFAAALLLISLLAAGCTPSAEQSGSLVDPASDVAETEEETVALQPVEEEEETTLSVEPEEDAMEPVEEQPESEDSQVGEAEVGEAVSPSTVNLSELTPEPIDVNATPQEMPRPGTPGVGPATYEAILADLEERLTISRDTTPITLIAQKRVEWSDSSLGCPEEGTAYLTVITPGFLVELEVDEMRYNYHTDLNDNFVYCENGSDGTTVYE